MSSMSYMCCSRPYWEYKRGIIMKIIHLIALPSHLWTYKWLHIPTGETGVTTQERFSADCIRWSRLEDALSYEQLLNLEQNVASLLVVALNVLMRNFGRCEKLPVPSTAVDIQCPPLAKKNYYRQSENTMANKTLPMKKLKWPLE